jgi:hypothetical protein
MIEKNYRIYPSGHPDLPWAIDEGYSASRLFVQGFNLDGVPCYSNVRAAQPMYGNPIDAVNVGPDYWLQVCAQVSFNNGFASFCTSVKAAL